MKQLVAVFFRQKQILGLGEVTMMLCMNMKLVCGAVSFCILETHACATQKSATFQMLCCDSLAPGLMVVSTVKLMTDAS